MGLLRSRTKLSSDELSDKSMSNSSSIRIIHPPEFDQGTQQTPGSERSAAVAPLETRNEGASHG
jgi:hypothetical protein